MREVARAVTSLHGLMTVETATAGPYTLIHVENTTDADTHEMSSLPTLK